jgi:transposase-like protein
VDLKGRLSNPLKIAETLAAQGAERIGGTSASVATTRIRPSDDLAEGPQEEKGRLSNPPQRRLSPTDLDDLLDAYRAGATINQLAAEFGIHRTTVAGHLDRHGVPRHSEQTAWDDDALRRAAELYATGSSLADIAHRFGVDAQPTGSDAQASPCDLGEVGHRQLTPNRSGAEHYRAREKGRSRVPLNGTWRTVESAALPRVMGWPVVLQSPDLIGSPRRFDGVRSLGASGPGDRMRC